MSDAVSTDQTISVDHFRSSLLFILDETFDNVHGAFLDPGDSLFTTLEGIPAAEASRKVGSGCSSIAAQVNHVIFYIDVALQYMRGENPGKQDWASSWTLTEVTESEWEGLKAKLRDRQRQLLDLIQSTTHWDNDDVVGGALALVAHTAYHLGEIRQAMCALRG